MRVAFISPQNHKCGISIYGARYAQELKKLPLEIETADPEKVLADPAGFKNSLEKFDIIHVQYEPSFFMKKKNDLFTDVFSKHATPIVLTLHEIYDKNPFVFPRENIRPPFVTVKKKIYDIRHPFQTMYRKHLKTQFLGAERILVHHYYHKKILKMKGISDFRIRVIGHPVASISSMEIIREKSPNAPVQLGGAGFINPQYDFDLLFRSLEQLSFDWQFTWVGGGRTDDRRELLLHLQNRVKEKNWEGKFRFTGWLEDSEFRAALRKLDLALCLFTSRSSSGSISDLLGSGIPVVSTDLPMTREIARDCSSVMIVKNDPFSVSETLENVCEEPGRIKALLKETARYCEKNSYEKKACELLNVYREVLS
ncbi:MAG: glycosyltransferase [Chitinispirillaceae bacterium]